MSKLKNAAVVAEIIKHAESITLTKLSKILFLVDYEYYKTYNRQLSDFTYRRYFYGPYPVEIHDTISNLLAVSIIGYTSQPVHYYITHENFLFNLKPYLSNEEREFIQKIVDKYTNKSFDDIMEEIMSIDEIKEAKFADIIL